MEKLSGEEDTSTSTSLLPVPSTSNNFLNEISSLKREETSDYDLNMKRDYYRNMYKRKFKKYERLMGFDNQQDNASPCLSRRLCDAVFRNEIEYSKTLLNRGVTPNCYDEHRRTPLHLAVSKGHCEMVQLLLNRGANPNKKDGLGNSCLHLAACANNVEVTLILIKGGAKVDSVDIRGRSPIQLAQSKLRILQQSPNVQIKSKVTQIIDMLILYLERSSKKDVRGEETELLSCFQNRLQVSDTPEQISNEIDKLSDILNQLDSLSLS